MNYNELKGQQAKRMNEFKDIFFAFNDKQFKEGLKELGVTEKDLVSTGNGGYMRKDKSLDFHKMLVDFDKEIQEFLEDDSNMLEALIYELNNHEYCITHCFDSTLDALGLKLEDIKPEIVRKAHLACKDEA